MATPVLSDKTTFNRLRINIEGAANKLIEGALKKFGEDVQKSSQLNLIKLKRVATRGLIDSIRFEIVKVGEVVEKGSKKIRFKIASTARARNGFRYGNTIEHGLKREIGGVKSADILKWIERKGIKPRKVSQGRSKATGRFLTSRTPTKEQLSRTIAFCINTSGRFATVDSDGDAFMQRAINKHFPMLERKLVRLIKESVKIKVLQ